MFGKSFGDFLRPRSSVYASRGGYSAQNSQKYPYLCMKILNKGLGFFLKILIN